MMSAIEILHGNEQTRAGLAESPLWDALRQCWFWIDIPLRQIHQHFEPSSSSTQPSQHTLWQLPNDPAHDIGALALSTSGELMLALRAGIARFCPDNTPNGSITPTIDILSPYDAATTRFNDGGVDGEGRWWIGSLYAPKTHAGANLFCLEHDVLKPILGEMATHEPYTNWGITTANGWAISPDGKTLYHADTQAHTVYRYDFDASAPVESALSNRRVFFQTQDTRGTNQPYAGRPDGAAVDSAGNYWCALYEGAAIVQIAPDGQLLQTIAVPAKCPTMVAFGGADLATLLITTAGNRDESELAEYPANGWILALRTQCTGLPTYLYQTPSS